MQFEEQKAIKNQCFFFNKYFIALKRSIFLILWDQILRYFENFPIFLTTKQIFEYIIQISFFKT